MTMSSNSVTLRLALYLTIIISLSIFSTVLFVNTGFSARLLICVLLLAVFISQVFVILKHQQRQLLHVIRAMANGDSSLGLNETNPLKNYIDEVKGNMKQAKYDALLHSEFLNALLVHIDIAVLVFNDDGKVIEINPAAARLLGFKPNKVCQLQQIEPIINACNDQLRTITDWQTDNTRDTFSIHISVAYIQGNKNKIVTLESIHTLLQQQEQRAYKQLTKVLTHEVANSITPLSSLADSCRDLLPCGLAFEDGEDKKDLELALKTISRRAKHLGAFIGRFKNISDLPPAKLKPVALQALVIDCVSLYKNECRSQNITVTSNGDISHLVMIDCSQIQQVLINLIKNAIESILQKRKVAKILEIECIHLNLGLTDNDKAYFEVTDTGVGVDKDAMDMIFIPFFTTKQQGSGIGLSLSRQIMMNHGGDLVFIDSKQGACFRGVLG